METIATLSISRFEEIRFRTYRDCGQTKLALQVLERKGPRRKRVKRSVSVPTVLLPTFQACVSLALEASQKLHQNPKAQPKAK